MVSECIGQKNMESFAKLLMLLFFYGNTDDFCKIVKKEIPEFADKVDEAIKFLDTEEGKRYIENEKKRKEKLYGRN